MNFVQILILAILQGAAELLPVSSSAHVIVAEKLMHLNPSDPAMTMLLVMLHTGTMFAVIAYFWKGWRQHYFTSSLKIKDFIIHLILGTICTLGVFEVISIVIKKTLLRGQPDADIETIFSNLVLIGVSLFAVGIFIIIAGIRSQKVRGNSEVQLPHAIGIGLVQGLALAFRGFSRSGSTISAGLLMGLAKQKLEEFSFALVVVLTPLAIAKEGKRLLDENKVGAVHVPLGHLMGPGLLGMALSFVAGFIALKWLSSWLEGGQWKFFGIYCIVASLAVLGLHYGMGL